MSRDYNIKGQVSSIDLGRKIKDTKCIQAS